MPTVDVAVALRFQAHPEAWLLATVLIGGYHYLLAAWGPRHVPGRPPATRRQRALFIAGAVLLWLGTDWPIHDLGEEYLYSVHMVQHLVFQLLAAPLLLLGTPAWLLRALLRPAWLQRALRAATKPLVALLAVNAYVALNHTTAWVDATVANGAFHFGAHVLLVVLSVLMWWPVLSPLPEIPHASYPGRMAYLFAHSIVPTVPASFLTFATAPLYAAYANAPRLNAVLTPVQDQQVAGLLMKIGGGLLLWGVIAALFFRWSHEEETGGPDVLYWHDLQADLPTPEPLQR